MKHVTPPTDGQPVELDLPRASVDAYSASPALRLRWQMLAATATVRSPQPVLPPKVGEPRECEDDALAIERAADDGHPLVKLMVLRAEAAAEVERLLTFLDTTEGIVEDEPEEDCAPGIEDGEEDTSDLEPSLGWPDGRVGQFATGGLDDRELAAEPVVTDADRRTFFRKRHGNVRPFLINGLK